MPVRVKEIIPNQHFTQPPARYTEATLIKALEETESEDRLHMRPLFLPLLQEIM